MIDNVTYSRSERCYRVINPDSGEIAEFPAGPDGRRHAFRLAVWLHDNTLYDKADKLAKRHPELEARAWKAAGLVLEGKVTPADNGQVVAFVEGTSEWGAYNIAAVNGELSCDCLDWQGMTAPLLPSGQRMCKHIIAYLFFNNS